MEFLQTLDTQILVGAAVALVAIGAGALYFYSSKKPKGLTFYFFFFQNFESWVF